MKRIERKLVKLRRWMTFAKAEIMSRKDTRTPRTSAPSKRWATLIRIPFGQVFWAERGQNLRTTK